jgi:uncharacterized repeat protein (TIGR03803 family)
MKNCKALLAVLISCLGPTLLAQQGVPVSYTAGLNDLTVSNITGALTAFNQAGPATYPNAAVYLALTRLMALPNDTLTSSFLGELGVSPTGRNVYHWRAKPGTNANGHVVLPTSFNLVDISNEIGADIVPTMILSESNLAQVSSLSFTLTLSKSVTHFRKDVTVDYGDVQMLRAILDAGTLFGDEITSWNLAANYGSASNIVKTDKSIEALLTNFPSLLTEANPAVLNSARAAFTSAANQYFAASAFIRARPANGPNYLFNLGTNEAPKEANFRATLSNLVTSLNGPTTIRSNSTTRVNLGAFFSYNSVNNLRAFFPTFANRSADFIWDSFPDTTLGGVVSGLSQTNLGKAFLKMFHAEAQLAPTNLTYTVVASVPDNSNLGGSLNGVVVGPDGNLYGTTPYGGANGTGAFFEAIPSTGTITVRYSGSANQMGSAGASSLVLGSDGNFYGTTQYGGQNGNGTIFKITPAGGVTSLYDFGPNQNGGANGGNPVIFGTDGNLYGTTQNGGANGAGIIFRFAHGGQFTTLYSFQPGNSQFGGTAGAGALLLGRDGNFYGVTQLGGQYGSGSLFEFAPSGNPQYQEYSFAPQMTPYGGQITLGINSIMQASNGLFYGTAQYGGANFGNGSAGYGDGFLFSIDGQGNFTDLYDFDENGFDGYGPVGAMAQGTNGSLYGITSSGGANGTGTIFKYKPGVGISFPVWFDEGLGKQQNEQNNNFNQYGYYNSSVTVGLVKAGSFIYGTAPNGGPNGNGVVFSITPSFNGPPSIVTPPAGGNFAVGSSPTLTVVATGPGNLTYQWARLGAALPGNVSGAATANLTFNSLTTADAGSYDVVVGNANGHVTSAVAVVAVVPPPTITLHPTNILNIAQGGTLSLTVGASGSSLTYEWLFNGGGLTDGQSVSGGNITGSATSNLVITPAGMADSGSYSVVVSNQFTGVTSHVSAVTVGVGPVVSAPANMTAVLGRTGTLSVTATGTAPLHFQWEKVGAAAAIPNATNATLTLANVAASTAGSYFVVVTNRFGNATSPDAIVTVQSPPAIGALPASVTLVQGGSTNFHVAATNGPFIWQWRRNVTNLLVTTSNLTVNPAYITNSGSYTVVVANDYGAVTSSVCVVTVSADRTVPTVTITSPTNGARVFAPVSFTGQAFETHVPITGVNFWITNLNGSPILTGQAVLTPGIGTSSNWTVNVSPYAGSNVFVVQGQNFSSTNSALVPLRFFLEAPAQLTLATAGTGSGTFTGTAAVHGDTLPGTNASLNVGEGYSITAIPGTNTYFVNWTGTVPAGTNPTLSFVMQENTSLTATFVTNIFLQMAGTYNGLFTNAAFGVTEETAGLLHILLGTNGTYSGTIFMGGAASSGTSLGAAPLSFSHSGYATNRVLVSPYGNLLVTFQVTANSSPRTITGQIIGTNTIVDNGVPTHGWTNSFTLVASLTNASFDAAAYNFLIPPTAASVLASATAPNTGGDVSTWEGAGATEVTIVGTTVQVFPIEGTPATAAGSSPTSPTAADAARLGASRLTGTVSTFTLAQPPGYGYCLIKTVPTNASVTLTGALADGTPFSQTVAVGEDNGLTFFIAPYTSPNNGIVIGQLSLSNSPTAPAPNGSLTWIRKGTTAGLFRGGFTNTPLPVQGSFWSNSLSSPYFQLVLTGGGLTNSPVTISVMVNGTNLVPMGGTSIIGNVNTNTGLFTITFANGGAQTARGAYLQDMQSGNGFFVLPSTSASPTNAGSISIQTLPPP